MTHPSSWEAQHRRIGLILLILPVLFNLILLTPDVISGAYPVNDHVLHQAASNRAAEAIAAGENPLDAWVGEFVLGYPLWRSYPPLPHVLTGILTIAGRPVADPGSIFLGIHYLLLSLLPLAFFALAWELELGWLGSGAAAALSITVAGAGQFSRFGLGYGAQVWRGSGLYTQLWGLFLALLGIALYLRLQRTGKGWLGGGIVVACACLSHFVAGFFAIATIALLSAFRRGETTAPRRLFRLLLTGAIVSAMSLFFVVPMYLDRQSINHSRWEEPWKWDSFGAPAILQALGNGTLLDDGRAPILTALLCAGFVLAIIGATPRRSREIATIGGIWLLLFFGRETWGHLLNFLAIPEDMHVHRFQMAFEVFGVLLAGTALATLLRWLRPGESRRNLIGAAVTAVAILAPMYFERARFLQLNTKWGLENAWAHQSEAANLQPILSELEKVAPGVPGRVHAGKAASWGGGFRIGATPMHGVIAQAGQPGSSFLYHSMSVASDALVLMDDSAPADLALFGIRFVVAPIHWTPPPELRLIVGAGRFRLYELPGGGLFDVIDVPYAFEGARKTVFEPSRDWLKHSMRPLGQHVAIYTEGAPEERYRKILHRWEPLPPPAADLSGPAGVVHRQEQKGENYRATMNANRNAYVLFRSSFHPGLRAEIDGTIVQPVMVTPGFAAFPVGAGPHQVRVFYEPGWLKTILFWLGAWALAGLRRVSRAGQLIQAEDWFCARVREGVNWLRPAPGTQVGQLSGAWRLHRVHLAVVLAVALLSLRPLYRGNLVAGHDSAEYPPRLVEFHENIRNGNFFPIWAPDLANGHGQPLFQFAPPLAYWAAEGFYLLGAGIADSLQFGALMLGLMAALALYSLGVSFGSRDAGLLMAATYLFSPYFHVNHFVRGNFMEAAAMSMLPVAAVALRMAVVRSGLRFIAIGAGGLALFLLSHNATVLLGLPFLLLLTAAFAGRDIARLLRGAAAVLLGMAIATWFLLPALIEKQYIHIDRLREGYLHYSGHFVTIGQLFFSPWGYGLSLPGDRDGMPFLLGPVHLTLAAIGGLLAFRFGASVPGMRRVGVCSGLGILAGVCMATSLSEPLWAALPTLQYIEFPWRVLAIPTLAISLLAGLSIRLLPLQRNLRAAATAAAVALLVVFNLSHAAPSGYQSFDDAFYKPTEIARLGINTTTREEYEPQTVQQRPAYSHAFASTFDCGTDLRIEEIKTRPENRRIHIVSTKACVVRLRLFSYPGWAAFRDGQKTTLRVESGTGIMLMDVPAGSHDFDLILAPTPLRFAARMLSFAALLVALWLLWANPKLPYFRSLPVGIRKPKADPAIA